MVGWNSENRSGRWGRRLCSTLLFSLVFSLVTPSSILASVTSGTASPRTTTRIQTPYLTDEIAQIHMAAADKFNMDNWTVGKVTLAQAFGVDKGTVSFPKLKPKLPTASAKSQQQSNLPAGDANPPTDKQIRSYYDLGKKMAAAQPYNWTGAQFTALNNLWTRESGWNPKAENPGSGAYGIPQALPGSKMASAGKDWETDPATQIDWGLQYIQQRYGTPERAWQHELAVGWY